MAIKVTPYKNSELGKKEQVEQMFDNVSTNYDFLNRVLTFGLDINWRRKVVKKVAQNNPKHLKKTGSHFTLALMKSGDIYSWGWNA
jgi:demethylmenaquinone methyltransferase/2-methoxy-6-polyprenyl-1,4-benzoquinol methylase